MTNTSLFTCLRKTSSFSVYLTKSRRFNSLSCGKPGRTRLVLVTGNTTSQDRRSIISEVAPNCGAPGITVRNKADHTTRSQADDDTLLENPIDLLASYSQVPLLKDTDYIFRPTKSEVKAAQPYFRPRDRSSVTVWKGAISVEGKHGLPESATREVAFLGRSNVGKSSLIKSLFYNAPLNISVSKTAGRTRTLKVYETYERFSLVDMPGYGQNMPPYYASCVETYLQTRPNLRRACLLLDLSLGVTAEDELGLEMMRDCRRPFTVVLTKCDTLTAGPQIRQLHSVMRALNTRADVSCFPQPFLVSSHSGAGLAFLRAFLAHVTSCNLQPPPENLRKHHI